MLGSVEDGSRDILRPIEGRRHRRLPIEQVALMLKNRGRDRCWLDERDRDRTTIHPHLDTQRVGVAFDRLLGGGVHAHVGRSDIRGETTKIDEGTALLIEMGQRGQATVHDTPEVHVEQPARIVERQVFNAGVAMATPALLIQVSIRPQREMTVSARCRIDAGSETSQEITIARPPDVAISSASAFSAASPRAATTTVAPRDAAIMAVARPIPLDAPVITIT